MRYVMVGTMCLAAWVAVSGGAMAQTPPLPPPAPSDTGSSGAPPTAAEMRELIDASRATARATRELVDYNRVMPDLLTQILTKLDKIEDKLGKVEDAIRAAPPRRR